MRRLRVMTLTISWRRLMVKPNTETAMLTSTREDRKCDQQRKHFHFIVDKQRKHDAKKSRAHEYKRWQVPPAQAKINNAYSHPYKCKCVLSHILKNVIKQTAEKLLHVRRHPPIVFSVIVPPQCAVCGYMNWDFITLHSRPVWFCTVYSVPPESIVASVRHVPKK